MKGHEREGEEKKRLRGREEWISSEAKTEITSGSRFNMGFGL